VRLCRPRTRGESVRDRTADGSARAEPPVLTYVRHLVVDLIHDVLPQVELAARGGGDR
jgi:hypothetical protein